MNLKARELAQECPRSETCRFTKNDALYGYYPTSYNGNIDLTDGSYDEWELSCGGIPMWAAGEQSPIQFSRAWIDWNCKSTLCVLVKRDGEYVMDDARTKPLVEVSMPTSVDVTPLSPQQKIYDSGNLVAIESCFDIDTGDTCLKDLEIHVNFVSQWTSSTGKTTSADGKISLDL